MYASGVISLSLGSLGLKVCIVLINSEHTCLVYLKLFSCLVPYFFCLSGTHDSAEDIIEQIEWVNWFAWYHVGGIIVIKPYEPN